MCTERCVQKCLYKHHVYKNRTRDNHDIYHKLQLAKKGTAALCNGIPSSGGKWTTMSHIMMTNLKTHSVEANNQVIHSIESIYTKCQKTGKTKQYTLCGHLYENKNQDSGFRAEGVWRIGRDFLFSLNCMLITFSALIPLYIFNKYSLDVWYITQQKILIMYLSLPH